MTDRLVLPQPAAARVLAGVITAYGFDTAPAVTCECLSGLFPYSNLGDPDHDGSPNDCPNCHLSMRPLAVGPVELWSSTDEPTDDDRCVLDYVGDWAFFDCEAPTPDSAVLLLPLGERLGTVNITDILPVTDVDENPEEPCVDLVGERLLHWDQPNGPGTIFALTDISDQRQYSTFTPGGFCAIFGDAP